MRRDELAFSITLPLLPQPERSGPAMLVLQAIPEARSRRIIWMDALLLKVKGVMIFGVLQARKALA